MRIHRHGPAEAALTVAEDVAALLEEGPLGDGKGSLLLPTGSTPRLLYARLRERHAAGELATAHWSSFNLDEYWPCAADNATSFSAFMHEELFTPLCLPAARCGLLDGSVHAEGIEAHCAAYEARIAASGGIRLAVLGLGINGHLAFNEPGSPWDGRTGLVDLTESTRGRAGFPGGTDGPRQALTVGLGTILEAERIVLLAFGAHKAEALGRLLAGERDPAWPVTCLGAHPAVTVHADAAALGDA
jgi:glucosamine-6-phosphate deaminase